MPKNMSFLPEDYLIKRVQRRTNVICLTLFVIVMGGVGGAWIVSDQQRAEVREQQKVVHEQYVEAAKRIEQLELLQQRKHQMVRKAKVTSVLIEHVPRSVILAELINNMPAALSLLEFDMETKVVAPVKTALTALERAKQASAKKGDKKGGAAMAEPAVPATDVSFKLMGVAPTDVQVAQFMTSLGGSALFEDVNLVFSEQISIEKTELRRFRIDLKLKQNVEMRALDLKRVARDQLQDPMAEVMEFDPDVFGEEPVIAPVANPTPAPAE